MPNRTNATDLWLRRLSQAVIMVLAGLLVFYHLTMLWDFANGERLSSNAAYNVVQAGLRIVIIAGLSGVVLGRRLALWVMWAGITSLIATHYWAHFGLVAADFTAGRHPLSYLKGWIIPTIITLAYLRRGAASPRQA